MTDKSPPTVWLCLTLLIVVTILLAGSGLVGAASGQSPDDAVSVRTSYDGTTPEQLIRIVVHIEAPDTPLSDVHIRTDNTQRTLVEPSSYTTKFAPSNQNVSVVPQSGGDFVVKELDPGERVTISFAVVPETLGESRLDAATVHIDYVKRGQRLTVDRVATADLSSNPWFRLQSAQERNSELAGQVGQQQTVFFAGLAIGLLGIATAAGMEVRRRHWVTSFENQLRDQLSEAYNELAATERPVIERIATRFDVDINGGDPGPGHDPTSAVGSGPGEEFLTDNQDDKSDDDDHDLTTNHNSADDNEEEEEFDASRL